MKEGELERGGRGVNICRFIKPNNLLSPPPRLIKISIMFDTVIIQAKPYDELKEKLHTMKYNCIFYKNRIKS